MGINEGKDKGHNLLLFLINKRPRLCVVSYGLGCKPPLACREQCTPQPRTEAFSDQGGLWPSPKQKEMRLSGREDETLSFGLI